MEEDTKVSNSSSRATIVNTSKTPIFFHCMIVSCVAIAAWFILDRHLLRYEQRIENMLSRQEQRSQAIENMMSTIARYAGENIVDIKKLAARIDTLNKKVEELEKASPQTPASRP